MKGLRIVQIAGPAEVDTVNAQLEAVSDGAAHEWWSVLGYVESIGDLLAASDLVVCRAGATTLAEVSALGKPSVLVPYPFATDDHQTHNAEPFLHAHAALVFADGDLDAPEFAAALLGLLDDPEKRRKMAHAASTLGRPGAAGAVLETVTEAASFSPWRRDTAKQRVGRVA